MDSPETDSCVHGRLIIDRWHCIRVGEKGDYSVTVFGELVNHVGKREFETILRLDTKSNCKWLEDINVINKIIF